MAVGILVVASLVQSIVAGVVAIRFAVAFAALIALGELLRLNLPGDREAAPIGTACGLAYALLIRVGPVPARHSAFQVVAVTGLGMTLGALPHAAVGRPARLAEMSSRLLAVACVALVFRPLAGMSDLVRHWWVALAAMALLVTAARLMVVFLSAWIRAAKLRARFWVTFTDELHVQGPLGVAVGASAMLIVFAAEAMGLLAVAVFIAPLLVTQVVTTPAQSVGSDFSTHGVGPVAVAGLLPNALYHVRLVATNSDGTTLGPDVTFTTDAAPAPGAPTVGKTVNVTPVSGFVLIKIDGKFVPLTGLEQIPSGSQIDARHGSLELITSTGQQGKIQHGAFGGAIFRLTQERSGASKGLVTLTLLEGAFKGAPSYAICKKHKAGDASAAAASSKVLQLLHASAHGKFRTSGRYSAATVRGTIWTVADRCDGTLTHDVTDSVAVKDFAHHKTIILHAGQSYLAKKP